MCFLKEIHMKRVNNIFRNLFSMMVGFTLAVSMVGAQAQTATTPKTGGFMPENDPVKVVYHMTEGLEQASRAMNNIKNHLAADPSAKIMVVGHGKGIDFMLQGAKDANGATYASKIEELGLKGIEFHLCNNTLESRKIDKSSVIDGVTIVPSGVADVARLQYKEKYAYLKP